MSVAVQRDERQIHIINLAGARLWEWTRVWNPPAAPPVAVSAAPLANSICSRRGVGRIGCRWGSRAGNGNCRCIIALLASHQNTEYKNKQQQLQQHQQTTTHQG